MSNLDNMYEFGVNCNLFIAHWGARVKLRPSDLGFMKGEEVNETLFSLGQKRLIEKDRMNEFIKIEQRARAVLDKFSFRFGDQFACFVPYNAIEETVSELEKHKSDFFKEVDNFIEEYPKLRDEMLDRYEEEAENIYKRVSDVYGSEAPPFGEFKDKLVHSIQDKYPHPGSVKERFDFSFSFYKISLPSDEIETELVDASERAKELKEKEIARRQIVNNYKGVFENQIKEFYGSAVQKLREATAEIMTKINKKNITDSRLEKIREHIKEFRMMNFISDNQLETSLNNLEKLIENKTAGNINSNAELNNSFNVAIESVIKTASEEVETEEVVRRFSRKIAIRKKSDNSLDKEE